MTSGMVATRARAKINLTLHIIGRRGDGWHALESLVAFAGTGDHLTLAPGPETRLAIGGPMAGLVGADADNLVLRAAGHLAARVPGLLGGSFQLTKCLPVASGIGGGSADAAAALRLLARINRLPLDDPRLIDAAAATGADVPVCLESRARVMRGRGEMLGPALAPPPLFALLVNPGVPLETRAVFARIGLKPGQNLDGAAHPPLDDTLSTAAALHTVLAGCRNDMQASARALAPAVADVLAALGRTAGCRLARMSGSGATCFGLFDDCHAAAAAAARMRRDHPAWWLKPTILR